MWGRYVHCLSLCVLLAFAGRACGEVLSEEDCMRGVAVMGVFYEDPCPRDDDPFEKLVDNGALYGSRIATVAQVQRYFTRYCNEAMPEVRRCMEDAMGQCSNCTQQQYVKDLALDTSEICAPRSNDISPWMTYVLARLSDGDVAYNGSCKDEPDRSPCRTKALNASRLNSYSDEFLQSASAQVLTPIVHMYYTTYMLCRVAQFRDSPSRCSNWRVRAFLGALSYGWPPPLGLQLNVTEAQMGELFEVTDRRRNSGPFTELTGGTDDEKPQGTDRRRNSGPFTELTGGTDDEKPQGTDRRRNSRPFANEEAPQVVTSDLTKRRRNSRALTLRTRRSTDEKLQGTDRRRNSGPFTELTGGTDDEKPQVTHTRRNSRPFPQLAKGTNDEEYAPSSDQ